MNRWVRRSMRAGRAKGSRLSRIALQDGRIGRSLLDGNPEVTFESGALFAPRSDGVRDHPGMPFGIIPDSAFGFAGIPIRYDDNAVLAEGESAPVAQNGWSEIHRSC